LNFVDSHCHLNLIEHDLNGVINRAKDAGVYRMIVPGINLETSLIAIRIAESFPEVYAAVGIHPHEVSKVTPKEIEEISQLALHPRVVAIGEIGLDYHFPPFDMTGQKKLLDELLDLAIRIKKPVILHSRDAFSDLFELVAARHNFPGHYSTDQKRLQGVFHMFEGNLEESVIVKQMGFYIGIGGNVTFKNNTRVQEIVNRLGLANLLLETDTPYVSPHPFRGKINEPSRVPIIANKVAEILQSQVELVAETTTRNAKLLFNLD
jgi:TatD DNase family protein